MTFKSKAGILSVDVCQIFSSHLKQDELVAFSHSRIFNDGSRAELWSHGEAMEHTYLQSRLTVKSHAPKLYESDEKFIFLPDKIHSFPDKVKENYVEHLSEMKNRFGLENTLLIKGNDPLCFELFCFYGATNSALVKPYLLNNISKFEAFIGGFKKNHASLIKRAEENRIIKPWLNTNKLRVKLTSREKLVAQYYSRGMTASAISRTIGIREKTVFNYLELLKDKYFLIGEDRRRESFIAKLRMDYDLFQD